MATDHTAKRKSNYPTKEVEGVAFNPYRRFTYAPVPNWLLERTDVSHGPKLMYGKLVQHAGKRGVANPRRKILAKELGISIQQTDRYIAELVDLKLIRVQQLGRNRANRYFFLEHPWIIPFKRCPHFSELPNSKNEESMESSFLMTPLKTSYGKEKIYAGGTNSVIRLVK
jgi:hypothetical protein